MTIAQLEARKALLIGNIEASIEMFKSDTGILDADIRLNPYQTEDKKGNKTVCYSPSISIKL